MTLMIDRERDKNDSTIVTNIRTDVKYMSRQKTLGKRRDPRWPVNRRRNIIFLLSL